MVNHPRVLISEFGQNLGHSVWRQLDQQRLRRRCIESSDKQAAIRSCANLNHVLLAWCYLFEVNLPVWVQVLGLPKDQLSGWLLNRPGILLLTLRALPEKLLGLSLIRTHVNWLVVVFSWREGHHCGDPCAAIRP